MFNSERERLSLEVKHFQDNKQLPRVSWCDRQLLPKPLYPYLRSFIRHAVARFRIKRRKNVVQSPQSRRSARDTISRMTFPSVNSPRHPQVCVLFAGEGWGGPVLHGLPHHEELLWRTRGLHKNQGLRRRGGRDRAGRRISFRDAGREGCQIRRCRPVGR